ncbi:MAG TPA: hypothetical protein VKU40_18300 [Thermoanaerobaculia bacterium]|nr:hypothetical protein [Thermoanaerobaculia bacterium]
MKRMFLTCGLVLVVATAVGFLIAPPTADGEEICWCLDANRSTSGSATGSSCGNALANLEAQLRNQARQDCQATYTNGVDSCNFQLDPIVSCFAIDPGGWGASGSATYDCYICWEKPDPPPGP